MDQETNVIVGRHRFKKFVVDERADSIELHNGDGRSVVGSESPEGHVWFHPDNDSDEVTGLLLYGVRQRMGADGKVVVTTPEGETVRVPLIGRAKQAV